ncbi:DUF721 domain-containing protein [Planctomycetales bacterium 10988]|nr:DUF721 domain-containing protein [Planctomycetales bacterium 10988]
MRDNPFPSRGRKRGKPQAIGELVAQLMTRRGYGRIRANTELAQVWQQVIGEPFAEHTRVGTFQRGTLEIIVTHSALVQELTFQQQALLQKLQQSVPEMNMKGLRFRVGKIG